MGTTLSLACIHTFGTIVRNPGGLFDKEPLHRCSFRATSCYACDHVIRKLNGKPSEGSLEGIKVLCRPVVSHGRAIGLPRIECMLGNVEVGKRVARGQRGE